MGCADPTGEPNRAANRREMDDEPLSRRFVVLVLFVGGVAAMVNQACAAVPRVQGPGVNSGQFRVTAFASGLNYPSSMQRMSDGSLLVATSDPSSVDGWLFNSTGRLLRLVDANDDGLADGPGVALATGLVGPVTSVRLAGDLVVVAHGASTDCQITLFRAGATPADPLTPLGSLALGLCIRLAARDLRVGRPPQPRPARRP